MVPSAAWAGTGAGAGGGGRRLRCGLFPHSGNSQAKKVPSRVPDIPLEGRPQDPAWSSGEEPLSIRRTQALLRVPKNPGRNEVCLLLGVPDIPLEGRPQDPAWSSGEEPLSIRRTQALLRVPKNPGRNEVCLLLGVTTS
jgi:hypothetical protein